MTDTENEKRLSELKDKYKRDYNNYLYLLGRKKGLWRQETEADKKRYNNLVALERKINSFKI